MPKIVNTALNVTAKAWAFEAKGTVTKIGRDAPTSLSCICYKAGVTFEGRSSSSSIINSVHTTSC